MLYRASPNSNTIQRLQEFNIWQRHQMDNKWIFAIFECQPTADHRRDSSLSLLPSHTQPKCPLAAEHCNHCVTRPKFWPIPKPRLFIRDKFFRYQYRDFFLRASFSTLRPKIGKSHTLVKMLTCQNTWEDFVRKGRVSGITYIGLLRLETVELDRAFMIRVLQMFKELMSWDLGAQRGQTRGRILKNFWNNALCSQPTSKMFRSWVIQ